MTTDKDRQRQQDLVWLEKWLFNEVLKLEAAYGHNFRKESTDNTRRALQIVRNLCQPVAEEVCAEAYQVVGSLLEDLGVFETERARKILDNLSQAKRVHKDVLPWPSFDRKSRGEPVAWLRSDQLRKLGHPGSDSPLNERSDSMMLHAKGTPEAAAKYGFDVPVYRTPVAAQPVVPIEPLIRFCPECGHLGDIDSGFKDCCPDGSHARRVPTKFAELCSKLFQDALTRRTKPVAKEITIDDLATEIWAVAQLVPGEGIEDGVDRIATLLLKKL